MSFISTAAHQQFVSKCESIIEDEFERITVIPVDDKIDKCKKDIDELQRLMDAYQKILLEIPGLTCKYYNLQRRLQVNMRKIQLNKNRSIRKNPGR